MKQKRKYNQGLGDNKQDSIAPTVLRLHLTVTTTSEEKQRFSDDPSKEKGVFCSDRGVHGDNDIGWLEQIPLMYVELTAVHVPRIESFEKWGNLAILRVSATDLMDLPSCDGLRNLEILDVSRNMLQRLVGIGNLTKLRELACSKNQITSLESLDGLVNLEKLLVSKNRLTKCPDLSWCVNLKVLNVSANPIGGTLDVTANVKLEKLIAFLTCISTVVGLECTTSLRSVHLEYTSVSGISRLDNATRIAVICAFSTKLPESMQRICSNSDLVCTSVQIHESRERASLLMRMHASTGIHVDMARLTARMLVSSSSSSKDAEAVALKHQRK